MNTTIRHYKNTITDQVWNETLFDSYIKNHCKRWCQARWDSAEWKKKFEDFRKEAKDKEDFTFQNYLHFFWREHMFPIIFEDLEILDITFDGDENIIQITKVFMDWEEFSEYAFSALWV